jgi:transposase-like protein
MSKSLTTKQQYWDEHLRQAQSFNGTVAAYARAEGLSVQSLYRWRHYLNQSIASSPAESSPSFTRVVSTPGNHHSSLTLIHGQTQLRFSALPEPQWLAQLITAAIQS